MPVGKILAILQARTNSSRLPGKVLMEIEGLPMLLRQIERIKRAKRIDSIVVATTTESIDDKIESLCIKNKIPFSRGDLLNVLSRFYSAAKIYNPAHIVRLTADCPLTDWNVIDATIDEHLRNNNDYTSTGVTPTFPDGLDVEVFTFKCLEEAAKNAFLPSHLEHVTPYIRDVANNYKLGNYSNPRGDFSHLRWTVDEPEDFVFVTNIYSALYSLKPDFSYDDIIALLEKKPELNLINNRFKRNEGTIKSKLQDHEFLNKKNLSNN